MSLGSIESLYNLLGASLSSTSETQRKVAEDQLLKCETQTGYSSSLLEIIINKGFDNNVRLAAFLQLKNVVDRHWKARRQNNGTTVGITEEEKRHLRSKLLLVLSEEDSKIATQLAVVLASIGRTDFPQAWPELLPRLIEVVQNTSSTTERLNALRSIYLIVKALSSRRLFSGRTEFTQISGQLFTIIATFWSSSVNSVLSALSSFSKNELQMQQLHTCLPLCEIGKLTTKILTIVMEYGMPSLQSNNQTMEFIKLVHERLKTFILCAQSVPKNPLSIYLNKFIYLSTKLIIRIQDSHPDSFGVFLIQYLDFFASQLVSLVDNPIVEEKFLVQCIIFIKNILDADFAENPQLNQAVQSFFSQERVGNLCNVFITKLFQLTPANLEEWESNPEDFFNEEEADSWMYKKKSCAETVFLTMLQKYRTWLAPSMAQMLLQYVKQPQTDLGALLLKDACYLAMGIGYFYFYDYVDFPSWLLNDLLKELSVTDPRYKLIRRRVAAVLGYWVIKVPRELRGTIYRILLTLMDDKDLVISLTASRSLKSYIDDLEFYSEDFMEFLPSAINLTFRQLGQVEESDSKLQVLTSLSIIISQLEEKMSPYIAQIIKHLAEQWKACESNESYNLVKQAIIGAVCKLSQSALTTADMSQRQTLLEFSVPLISYSTDITKSESIYLIEEALQLWYKILSCSTQLDNLLLLFPRVATIIDQSFENIQIIMRIVEEYLVLGKVEFLQAYGNQMVFIFDRVIGNVKDEPTLWTLKPIETYALLFPSALPFIEPLLQKILITLVFIPSSQEDKPNDRVVTQAISIFARVILANQEFFFAFFNRLSQSTLNQSRENLLLRFLDVWLDKIDCMAQPKMRKLTALALCNLLVTTNIDVLKYLGQLINACISVIHDTLKDKEEYDPDEYDAQARSGTSKKILFKIDPVFHILTRDVLMQKLNESAALNGPVFNQMLSTVDPVILTQLERLKQQ